jgi:N-acetylmuramoyl-L-alanine amidase
MKAHRFLSLTVVIALLLAMFAHSAVTAAPSEQRAQFTAPVLIVNSSFLNVRTGPGLQYGVLLTVVGGSALPVLGVSRDRVWYQVSTVVGTGWVNSQYTLARGDFANVPFAEAPAVVDAAAFAAVTSYSGAVNNLDDTAVDLGFSNRREWGVSVITEHPLRAQPTINAVELTFLNPDLSIIYTVIGATFAEGINWIQIATRDANGREFSGWLEETKLRFRPYACTLSAVSFTQTAEIKRGPDGTGPAQPVPVSQGAEAYLLDRINDAYKVELIDGTVGWAAESFIAVRQGDVRNDYCARVQAGVGQGAPGVPGSPNSGSQLPAGVAFGSIPHIVINTGFLNVRSGPGVQFTSVATVAGGAELAVIGIAPDRVWYLVQGSFGQGWLNSEFTLFRGDGSRLPIIRGAIGVVARPTAVINGAVTLYAAPNLTLGSLGTLTGPVQVELVARTADFNWVQVNTTLGFGWVQREFVVISGDIGAIPVIG